MNLVREVNFSSPQATTRLKQEPGDFRIGVYDSERLETLVRILKQDIRDIGLTEENAQVEISFSHSYFNEIKIVISNPLDRNERAVFYAYVEERDPLPVHEQKDPHASITGLLIKKVGEHDNFSLHEMVQDKTYLERDDSFLRASEVRFAFQEFVMDLAESINEWTSVSKSSLYRLPQVIPASSKPLPILRSIEDDFRGDVWNPDDEGNRIRSDFLVTDRVRSLISMMFPNGLRGLHVLDAGCGSGEGAIWLAKQGAQVFAFDYLKDQIVKLQEKLEELDLFNRVNFCVGDVTDMSFLPQGLEFDLILNLMVHLYLNDEQFKASLQEIPKHLKDQGIYVYANDFPPRYLMFLNNGTNLYSLDGDTDTTCFENEKPNLFDTLKVTEVYPRAGGGDPWQTTFEIHPMQDVFNCISTAGMRINQVILPRPTTQELVSYPEMMKGADVVPAYMILVCTK